MELSELRWFQVTAEVRSLSRAAIQLGVTQPALTRRVRKLEDELGVALFYRNGRGVTLTAAGNRLLSGAVDLLAEEARLRHDIIDGGLYPSGTVAIGMPPSFCTAIGATIAAEFPIAYPDASLRLYEHFSATLLEWVASARLDLAVLYDVRRVPSLLVQPLFRESLFLISPPGALPPLPSVSVEALGAYPLILPGLGNGLRREINQAAARAGVELSVRLELDSLVTLKHLVESGHGRTVLPFGAVHREVRDGRLQATEIDPSLCSATVVLATPALQPVTAATRALAKFLVAKLRECVAVDILRGDVLSSPGPTAHLLAGDNG